MKFELYLFLSLVLLGSCSSLSLSGAKINNADKEPTKVAGTTDKPKYSYFEPSFDFSTFFLSDFYNCDKHKFNYIMTVKLQAKPNYPNNDPSLNIIVYDYRPKNFQDFQVLITVKFDNKNILNYIKLVVPRNATLQQTVIRLSLFRVFDKSEEYLTSNYGTPWLSINNIIKKESSSPDELYKHWLSVGESEIEKGEYISRWYTLQGKNGEVFDLMSLKLEPDLVFEMYPVLIKEKLEEHPL